MNELLLQELGLTKTQAAVYAVLVKNSPASPPALAKIISESRTNTYKVLDTLEQLGLATRDESGKKIQYWASNPSVLRDLAHQKQLNAEADTRKLEAALPQMLETFFENSIQPAVSFKQGRGGIVKVFEDYAATGQDLHIVRSYKDRDYLVKGVLSVWRKKPSSLGITTHMLAPDTESASTSELDKLYLIDKTWMHEDDYTAPVEWCAYGDKLAIISYGDEAVSTIIQSKQIADGFKQLFNMLTQKQRLSLGYNNFPQKARLSDDSAVINTPDYKKVVEARQKYIQKHGH